MWSALIRITVVTALLGVITVAISPVAGGLAAFAIMTVWVHGPISPFLPAAYEPVLMHYGTLYPPMLVALVGTVANLAIEAVNYGLYRDVVNHSALARMRETRLARWSLALFRRSPFLAVWIGTWSPIPDWTVRILGPMSRYPRIRYLVAMGLGRAPRYWFFAELGRRFGVPKSWIVAALGLSLGLGLVAVWRARWARRAYAASDVAPSLTS